MSAGKNETRVSRFRMARKRYFEEIFPQTIIKPANEVENAKTQSRNKKRFPVPFQKNALVLPGQNLLSA
jgi:hypothetical protein